MRIPLISTAADLRPPDPAASPGYDPSMAARPFLGLRTLTVLFMAESLALALFQLPLNLLFDAFASMDQGANLTVQGLLDRGLTPTVDFGYQYGLIPLLAGRAWFALLGRTPRPTRRRCWSSTW